MRRDVATVWHSEDAGQTFTRSVYAGIHVEERTGETTGTSGTEAQDTLTAIFFGDPKITPGDYIIASVSSASMPPDGARIVRSVNPYRLFGRHHHTEVKAR